MPFDRNFPHWDDCMDKFEPIREDLFDGCIEFEYVPSTQALSVCEHAIYHEKEVAIARNENI
jgi:hypothetical protein